MKMRSRSGVTVSILILCTCMMVTVIHADSREDDRFRMELGAFLQSFETTLRLDSETLGKGTEINLENDLGLLDGQDNFRIDGTLRMADKHRLDFGYVSWNRHNTRVIDEELQFGDEIYPINATIMTRHSTDVFKFVYKYSFINSDTFEAGISGGLSVFDVAASLDVEAGGGGASAESEDLIAPVPMLGGFFDWKINPKLVLRTSGEVFDLSTGGYEGHVSDVKGTINWYPWRHFGLGAGFNRVGIRFLDDGPNAFEFKYVYSGATAFVIFSF